MTQDDIVKMALEAGYQSIYLADAPAGRSYQFLERFAALVVAHKKSEQINLAYQQGCEDMKLRMEKRIQHLEGQLQLCQTAVANEREACAKVAESIVTKQSKHINDGKPFYDHMYWEDIAAAIRARGENAG